MSSVKVILRTDKINIKNGEAPLYIRIIKNRKTKFISLGIKINPKYWNEEKMSVKKGATNYQELNNYIIQKRAEAEKTALNLESGTKLVTTENIKEKILGKKPKNFFDYSYKRIETLKDTLSPSTYRNYNIFLYKLEKYLGHRNLNFSDIDINFIKDYESYMYKELGNTSTTVEFSFRVIKIFFNHAINEGYIESNIYPFKNYKFKVKKAVKNYLNNDQFEAFLNYKKRHLPDSDIFYDMFVFACYAGGLRFIDVLELKWLNYVEKEQRISKVIRKTKRKHQFKLPAKAVEIIEKYKIDGYKQTDYIFPLLNNNFDYEKNKEIIYKHKTYMNERANITLERIGKDLELPFKLTFHTSRHTFATRALNKGMRIEHVSKILDHTKISVTQIYAKIVNEELDKAMEIFND